MSNQSSKFTKMQNLLFFTFFLSRGGSFSAFTIKLAADGTTEIAACLFWIVKHTVIFKPFQSAVALAISSPTFLGDWIRKKNIYHTLGIPLSQIYLPNLAVQF
jgi:hypothetical protein